MKTEGNIGSHFRLFGKHISGLRWFWILSLITIVSATVYLLLHWFYPDSQQYQKMIVQMSKEQTIVLNSILAGTDTLKDVRDENKICSAKENIKRFIFFSFPEMERQDSINTLRFIDATCLAQLKILLPDYPIRQHSFFWLYSNGIYFELIFWSLFGVLCNLLYYTGEHLRKNDFDNKEVFVHASKMFYSPFCVIIIYLSYNQVISSGPEYDIKYSLYSIVVAFLLGFFSGRMIDLLNKIKEVLLPSSTQSGSVASTATNTPAEDNPNPMEVEEEEPESEKDLVAG